MKSKHPNAISRPFLCLIFFLTSCSSFTVKNTPTPLPSRTPQSTPTITPSPSPTIDSIKVSSLSSAASRENWYTVEKLSRDLLDHDPTVIDTIILNSASNAELGDYLEAVEVIESIDPTKIEEPSNLKHLLESEIEISKIIFDLPLLKRMIDHEKRVATVLNNKKPETLDLIRSAIPLTVQPIYSEDFSAFSEKALKYLETAQNYANNNQMNLALSEIEKSIKEEPGLLSAQLIQADLYNSKNDPRKAIEILESLLQKNPGYTPGYLLLAVIYSEMGLRRHAWGVFTDALMVESNKPELIEIMKVISATDSSWTNTYFSKYGIEIRLPPSMIVEEMQLGGSTSPSQDLGALSIHDSVDILNIFINWQKINGEDPGMYPQNTLNGAYHQIIENDGTKKVGDLQFFPYSSDHLFADEVFRKMYILNQDFKTTDSNGKLTINGSNAIWICDNRLFVLSIILGSDKIGDLHYIKNKILESIRCQGKPLIPLTNTNS
jgi:tetratricopeptide (TPR) repeat protein